MSLIKVLVISGVLLFAAFSFIDFCSVSIDRVNRTKELENASSSTDSTCND